MVIDHREAWFFCQDHVEVFADDGNPDFPIERIVGAQIEQGNAAMFGACQFDNAIAWLGAGPRGGAIAWRANGYNALRISTYAVEWHWNQYSTVADAISYTYQEKGHTFWVINFPSGGEVKPDGTVIPGGATWVYDAGTRMWHERSYWADGRHQMHLGQFHLFDGTTHYVCGQQSGKIYKQSIDYYDDAGTPIKSVRSAPHIYSGGKRIFYNAFFVDAQFGVGLDTGQGQIPQICMDTSDDGGMTWSNERWESFGVKGQYAMRVGWWQCGVARDRCFRVTVTDPVPRCLIGAYIDVTEGQY